jgi:ATP-dependent Lon protease
MVKIKKDDEIVELAEVLPLLPLRDVVMFPGMVVPLMVGRKASIDALEAAMSADRIIFMIAQKKAETASPKRRDIHDVGTISRIAQILRLPDGTVRILAEGLARARIVRRFEEKGVVMARVVLCSRKVSRSKESKALLRAVKSQFEEYIGLNPRVPDEVLLSIAFVREAGRLADTMCAHTLLSTDAKQTMLEAPDLKTQLGLLGRHMASEIEILKLEKKLDVKVKDQFTKNQKEFYLHEKLKAIKKELGYEEEGDEEYQEISRAVEQSGMPEEASEKAYRELGRLMRMAPTSPEAAVIRNYLDWLVSVPWKSRTKDNLDIKNARRILDEDHYGLEKIKQRLIEYLAVLKLVKRMKGQILCFVGAPGVGKTSLGKSIARALGRNLVRASLGGVRDEAEIRGHRRTYIGAMPGRIIQRMKDAGTKNPVFLLDEVDKLGTDFRGDPASALLEVLDPEVNSSFSDHYLEAEFDLSEVLFICTANVLHTIPPALVDRMEVIRLPGYLEHEKLEIAKSFLVPRQLSAHGLKGRGSTFTEGAVLKIIRCYTREAGVRNLEREIASVCRKMATSIAGGEKAPRRVGVRLAEKFLGAPRYLEDEIAVEDEVGVATGLAWTEMGGDTMSVEVGVLRGKGELILTGKLGDVMKESARAAFSYVRSRSDEFGLDRNFYKKCDLHVHIPEGAIPKDGPSAGVAIASAMVSALTGIPIRRDVAMTGEITLRGKVLPVGGLSEKVVAAQRAGISRVLVPKKNAKEIKELPQRARENVSIELVSSQDEVLKVALKRDVWKDAREGVTHSLYAN